MYETVGERYADKSVLITGSTGFIGKVLIEKLLYGCPNIGNIYCLLRCTDNVSAEERVQSLLKSPAFNRIKDVRPNDLKKVKPIAGDISQPNLGLRSEDEQILIETVSIVFHSAAIVKFNEDLNVTLETNFNGTKRMLNLCQRMKKIKVLVHVSTAFANAHESVIEEVLYRPPVPLDMVDQLIQHPLSLQQTKNLLGIWPNTYTFAKSLSENYVAECHGNVPVVIVRPSIVSASHSEPGLGWLDSWNGATALMAAIGKGIIRAIRGSDNNIIDLIPVDYVTNLLIVVGAKYDEGPSDVKIYHCCSSTENPLTLKQLTTLLIKDAVKHKFNDLPLPSVLFSNSKWLLKVTAMIFQTIPAYLGDLLTIGKKPRYKKMLLKACLVRDALEYFTSHSWKFSTTNTASLAMSLQPADRLLFPFTATTINWSEYIPIYCRGIREHLFKIKSSCKY